MNEPLHRRSIDPAVADLLGGMENRAAERKLDKAERNRVKREREKARRRAKAETRTTVDLLPRLRERIQQIAQKEGTTTSQIINLACYRFLVDVAAGRFDLVDYKRPAKSPKYDWLLEIPPIVE